MSDGQWYSLAELSKEYNIPNRTLHNRLETLRKTHPEGYFIIHNDKNHPKFYYNRDLIDDNDIKKRHYEKKQQKGIDYEPPPVIVKSQKGEHYNLVGLKALLKVVTDRTLFEKFTGMLMLFWAILIIYFQVKI